MSDKKKEQKSLKRKNLFYELNEPFSNCGWRLWRVSKFRGPTRIYMTMGFDVWEARTFSLMVSRFFISDGRCIYLKGSWDLLFYRRGSIFVFRVSISFDCCAAGFQFFIGCSWILGMFIFGFVCKKIFDIRLSYYNTFNVKKSWSFSFYLFYEKIKKMFYIFIFEGKKCVQQSAKIILIFSGRETFSISKISMDTFLRS